MIIRKAVLILAGIVGFRLLTAELLPAQVAGSSLSGTITDRSGAVVPNVKISVRNVATSQSTETRADSAGVYNVPTLAPGDYEISVTAEGFPTQVTKLTITQGAKEVHKIRRDSTNALICSRPISESV